MYKKHAISNTIMAFWKKKSAEYSDELPPIPDSEELPPLPPLSDEDLTAPEPLPREARMRPAAPSFPEVSMAAPISPGWRPPTVVAPISTEKATVFVRLDKYREIMKTIEMMQAKIDELTATLERVASIKQREGEIIDGWHAMLADAKEKMDDISAKLSKPEA